MWLETAWLVPAYYLGMKKAAWILAILAFLLSAQGGDASAEDSRTTLSGSFVWEEGGSRGKLRAVFTTTGPGAWGVDIHFRFHGQTHVYSGTAEGSLTEGELRGTVQTESRQRTFTFRGKFENGTFRGTHAEVRRGRERRTGTLTLEGAGGYGQMLESVAAVTWMEVANISNL